MTEAQLGKKELTVFHLEASLLLANKCKYLNFSTSKTSIYNNVTTITKRTKKKNYKILFNYSN